MGKKGAKIWQFIRKPVRSSDKEGTEMLVGHRHLMVAVHCFRACPVPGLAGVLRKDASFTNLGFRGGLEVYPSLQRYGMMHHSGKRNERKPKKEKKKDCLFSLAEVVSQGFAGENYARRASFSMGKRRSRLTLTGRRRQATFAVFLFLDENLPT